MHVSLQKKNLKCWLCEKCKITTWIMLDNYSYLCVMDCPLPSFQLELPSRGWWALNLPPVPSKFLKTVKLNCPSKVIKLDIGKKEYWVFPLAYWEWLHSMSSVAQTTGILPRYLYGCCSKCCAFIYIPYCIRLTSSFAPLSSVHFCR